MSQFTIQFHHGGRFVGVGEVSYEGGSVALLDNCDGDEISRLDILNFAEKLKYKEEEVKDLYYKLPKHGSISGNERFVCLQTDEVVSEMAKHGSISGIVAVYLELHSCEIEDLGTHNVGVGELAHNQVRLDELARSKPSDECLVGVEVMSLDEDIVNLTGNVKIEVDDEVRGDSDEDYCPQSSEENSSGDEDFLTDDEEAAEVRAKVRELKRNDGKEVEQQNQHREVVREARRVEEPLETPTKVRRKTSVSKKSSSIQVPLNEDSGEITDYMDSSDYDTFSEDEELEEKTKKKFPVYDPNIEHGERTFTVGMQFTNSENFKNALIAYSKQAKRDIRFTKSEQRRVQVRCACKECNWRVYASFDKRVKMFQVKSINNTHTCVKSQKNRQLTSTYLAKALLEKIRKRPNMKMTELRDEIRDTFGFDVTMSQCSRTKLKAIGLLHGTMREHFERLWDYVYELRSKNPGSTIELLVQSPATGGNAIFQRLYICFNALATGWKEGCRPIIGLDGCFLKWFCKGELLCAVGRDANDQVFPIAWAVVEVENLSSWSWFLRFLFTDLGISSDGCGLTIISDKQNGLVQAITDTVPLAEHRKCARHVYANWKKNHPGRDLKFSFYKAAKCTTREDFDVAITEMARLSSIAANDFKEQDPNTFCRAFFQTWSGCDSIDNNMSKTFNGFILKARKKPIIDMVEEIRRQVMARMARKQREIESCNGFICPRIQKKLDENKSDSCRCEVLYNRSEQYEVRHQAQSYIVNLTGKSCTCRAWDLSGIPCSHAIAAIWTIQGSPEEFVGDWCKRDSWAKCYAHAINPVHGSALWEKKNMGVVLPPVERRMPGRPKTKRVKDPHVEIKGSVSTLSRHGRVISCKLCHEGGHNRRGCPNKDKGPFPPAQQGQHRKRGRPRKDQIVEEYMITPARGTTSNSSRRGRYPSGCGLYASPMDGSTIYMMEGQQTRMITMTAHQAVRGAAFGQQQGTSGQGQEGGHCVAGPQENQTVTIASHL